jgi:hypothetical protein
MTTGIELVSRSPKWGLQDSRGQCQTFHSDWSKILMVQFGTLVPWIAQIDGMR